nr:MAG TPA: hypothetical protein [Caudoviricetes sp.]
MIRSLVRYHLYIVLLTDSMAAEPNGEAYPNHCTVKKALNSVKTAF